MAKNYKKVPKISKNQLANQIIQAGIQSIRKESGFITVRLCVCGHGFTPQYRNGILISKLCPDCRYKNELKKRNEQRDRQKEKVSETALKSKVVGSRETRRPDYSEMDHKHLLAMAIRYFNAFIRKRDELPDKTYFCPTCGHFKIIKGRQYQACHCFPAGTCSALRFNELNVYGGCLSCNYFAHGVNHRYNDWVRRKIGDVEYLKLEILSHTSGKFDRFELIMIIETYKEKIKQYAEK